MSQTISPYSDYFVDVTNAFLKECEKIRQQPLETVVSLDGVLSTLPHVNPLRGYVYEVLTPCFNHLEYKNLCYAREDDSPNEQDYYWAKEYIEDIENPPLDMLKFLGFKGRSEEPEDIKAAKIEKANSILNRHKWSHPIEEKVKFDFTPESAWECLLLNNLWITLSRDEDSTFYLGKYVFNWKECLTLAPELTNYILESGDLAPYCESHIICSDKPFKSPPIVYGKSLRRGQFTGIPSRADLRAAVNFLKDKPSMLPYAEMVDDRTINLTYYEWSSWGGLDKITYRATINKGGRIKFALIGDSEIFGYYFKMGYCPFMEIPSSQILYRVRPIRP